MAFVDNPIINSPFERPKWHFELEDDGQPTGKKLPDRRRSIYVVPVPAARRRGPQQRELSLEDKVTENVLVNEIRRHVGTALDLLRANSSGATAMVVEADPVATAIRELVEQGGSYVGLVSGLYAQLSLAIDPEIKQTPAWPKGAARFGEQLRRVAPALRATGIGVEETRKGPGMRVTISRGAA